MSRGLGVLQRTILDVLGPPQPHPTPVGIFFGPWVMIAEVAEATGRGDNQVRAAVRALERRGLIKVGTRVKGWRKVPGWQWRRHPESSWRDVSGVRPDCPFEILETVRVKAGDPWPPHPLTYRATRDTQVYKIQRYMPVMGHIVSPLPQPGSPPPAVEHSPLVDLLRAEREAREALDALDRL